MFKCSLTQMSNQPFECEVVAGARQAFLSISETADLFHTVSGVYRGFCQKSKEKYHTVTEITRSRRPHGVPRLKAKNRKLCLHFKWVH